MSPQRIQRRRVKGWRMPAGAVYVGRGAIWGNPFRVGEKCAVWHRAAGGGPVYLDHFTVVDRAHAVRLFAHAMRGEEDWRPNQWHRPMDLGSLRGKDLACWCPLDQPCHADVLLELANGENVKNIHNQECAQ